MRPVIRFVPRERRGNVEFPNCAVSICCTINTTHKLSHHTNENRKQRKLLPSVISSVIRHMCRNGFLLIIMKGSDYVTIAID